MRSEDIEQNFFRVFGIEPEINYVCDKRPCEKGLLKTCADIECSHLYDTREDYPDITAEKFLKIICILGNGKDGSKNLNLYTANEDEWFAVLKDQYNSAYCASIDKDFKNAILKLCIYRADINDFKQQIQQLFKEE